MLMEVHSRHMGAATAKARLPRFSFSSGNIKLLRYDGVAGVTSPEIKRYVTLEWPLMYAQSHRKLHDAAVNVE